MLGASGDIATAIGAFAEEVAPDVRDRVHRERAGGSPTAGEEPLTRSVPPDSEPSREVAEIARPASQRDGNWGVAGGLPVTDRPRVDRSAVLASATARPPVSGRDNHRNLVAIHDHLRSELEQIADAVQQVSAGELGPAAARSLINRMTMRQNHWTLGSFCAAYCRIVTIHHTIEDTSMFPNLAAVAPALQPVLDRLEAEHAVIAGVLDRFDRALVDLVREQEGGELPSPSGTVEIGTLATELADVLRSHLAYEEDELMDGLALMPPI